MLRRAAPWLILAIAVGLTASYARRPGDLQGYVEVGNLVLDGRHPYHAAAAGISTWPPFFWAVAVPLALAARVSVGGTRALWLAVNWLALYFSLAALTRLVHGRRVSFAAAGLQDRLPLASAAILVPLLLTVRYVLSNYEHLQINVVILALVLCGLALVWDGRHALGGAAIGAAAALKIMPALLVPYFLWRRQYRAAGWTAGWTVALSLSPAAVFGWRRYQDYVSAWRDAVASGWGVGRMNQSVYAMLDRMIGHGLVPFIASVNDLAPSREPAVMIALLIAFAAVVLVAARTFRGPVADGKPDRRTLAEWSIVLLVAALFGPVSWKAYLVVLLLPNMLLFAAWRDPAEPPEVRRLLRATALVAFGLGLAAADVLVGRRLAARLETASVETWAGLLVLGTLLWYRRALGAGPASLRA